MNYCVFVFEVVGVRKEISDVFLRCVLRQTSDKDGILFGGGRSDFRLLDSGGDRIFEEVVHEQTEYKTDDGLYRYIHARNLFSIDLTPKFLPKEAYRIPRAV